MKVGLALSGGGALGAAHIGTLSELERNNVKIDSVCGSSAGAIVGLLYSCKGIDSVNRFFQLLRERNVFRPMNVALSRSPGRLFAQIEDMLREVVGSDSFSGLNVRYSCVATNLVTGEAEILASGDPVKCAMASSAYPGVFPVQQIGDTCYVDGGVSLNMPVGPLRDQGIDFVIASSVYWLPRIDPSRARTRRLRTAIRALEIMEYRLNERELLKADFVFRPPVGQYAWFSFRDIEPIRRIGESYAMERIRSLDVGA